MDLKHQKYELNENTGEDELIRNLKVIVYTAYQLVLVYLSIFMCIIYPRLFLKSFKQHFRKKKHKNSFR